MSAVFVNYVALALFSGLLLVAAKQDLTDYRIPNNIIIALAALYPLYVLSAPSDITWWWSLVIACACFAIGLVLFSTGVMGGGDVKLIAVTGLWVGLEGVIPFLLIMALVGGAMSLFMMTPLRFGAAYLCTHMGLSSVHQKIMTDQLPYGVAICAGGLYAAYSLAI